MDPATRPTTYSDVFVDWLVDLGYTHCFFVAGGNIMHLLDAVRRRMQAVPVVHEVAAGIAAEYFNASDGEGRAFALVTAGPGLTNVLTAMAGAHIESRELLVVGGQVKSSDLARGSGVRQRGIQEVDGVAMAAPVSVVALRVERPLPKADVIGPVLRGATGRPGPVFLEFCLDAQGAPVDAVALDDPHVGAVPVPRAAPSPAALDEVHALLRGAQRPVLLLGGGVDRQAALRLGPALDALGVPLMTTYNGTDRVGTEHRLYAGRPNTWGMRSANVLVQQADVVVALGTRLGLQQTGFNWQAFGAAGSLVQVDLDEAELHKGHPRVDVPIVADATQVLEAIAGFTDLGPYDEWVSFVGHVRDALPVSEAANTHGPGYIDPYDFFVELGQVAQADDLVIPCSSGGSFTVFYQAFPQKAGQVVLSDKGLASMGYGLGGAIGAAFAHPGRRVVHVEGDGGFAQNLQELATVAVNRLPIKMFVMSNEGYASIRMTQKNYFGGEYLGCDIRTGLGFPDWTRLAQAFGIDAQVLAPGFASDEAFAAAMAAAGPCFFVVPVDPEQTYFPKISSRVAADGGMESNPLHLLSPDLPQDVADDVLRYLKTEGVQA